MPDSLTDPSKGTIPPEEFRRVQGSPEFTRDCRRFG